jgi:sugar lactone lactonase YvrE
MRSHKTTVFADDFWLLEGPRWREGRLWVSDLLDGKVYSLDADGKRTLVCEVPNRPSGLGFMPDGALIIASMQDRKVLKHANGVTTVLADLCEHATGDVNDLLVDERGYTYVGNFGYDLHNGAPSTPTNMHVISPDGVVRVAASGLEFPNGTVIADGGRTLIVAETWAGRLTAFDRDEEGRLSNRRIFAALRDRQPDGICLDSEGAVWAACYNTGEVVRVREGGEITDRVECGKHTLACALGGSDGRTLFCMTYVGTETDIGAGKRLGQIFATRVDSPAAR